MKLTTALRALGPMDALSVRRDAMLRWMILLPLVITLAMRLVMPLLVARLDLWIPLDLQLLYQPIMGAVFLLLVPFLWGMVSGFLLLDERDDNTLTALLITPLPPSHYLLYRLGLPTTLSAATTLVLFPLAHLAPLENSVLFLLSLTVAPLAPVVALLLAALAQNKVQGLAMTKASGLLILPPLVSYFLPAPWQWLASISPTFWPVQAYWQALQGQPIFWLTATAGIFYQLWLVHLLAKRFDRIMHR